MARQDVDRAALAAKLKRDFRDDFPAGALKPLDRPFDEAGVFRVQQPVESLTLPQDLDDQTRAKLIGDALEGSDGRGVSMAALDSRDR